MDTPLTAAKFLEVLRDEINGYTATAHRPPSVAIITRTHWDAIKVDIDEEFKHLQFRPMLDDGPAPVRSCIKPDGSAADGLKLCGVRLIVLEDRGMALL